MNSRSLSCLRVAVGLLAAACSHAIAGDESTVQLAVASSPVAGIAAGDCEALARVELDQVKITSAKAQPAGEPVAGAKLPNMTGTPGAGPDVSGLPAFCRVVGSIHPESDSDIRFEVWLPEQGWDGRFNGANSGGFAGYINYMDLSAALRAGQASAGSDTGHAASPSDGAWAQGHPAKVRDYGWRAVHLTTVAAKQLIAAFYGRGPEYSYFIGCSNGGRQALMEASRFPDDYDGIIAGAPAAAMTTVALAMVNAVQAQMPPGADIRPEQAALLQDEVIKQCDAVDGQVDGLIADPRLCQFDAGKLACGVSDSPQCFTEPQITALEKIHAGRRDAQGNVVAYGFPPSGAEVGVPAPAFGWDGSILARFTSDLDDKSLAEGILTELVQPPVATTETFDFTRDPARLAAAGAADLDAQPDLTKFFERGGKLIVWHGWGDAVLPPEPTVDFYEDILSRSGSRAGEQSRLFMVPGVGHCAGGTGPDAIGQIGAPPPGEQPERSIGAALQAWVEDGRAPDSIIGRRGMVAMMTNPGAPERQRLICAYPAKATLAAGADPDKAASYTCQ